MHWSSLRLTMLDLIARLLRRWLKAISAQLEPAGSHEAPSVTRAPQADSRQPAPPDHWVELVQQYAPQLLEPDAPGVIDYRADRVPVDRPTPVTPMTKARLVRLLTPQHRSATVPLTVKSAPKRPMRLERMGAQVLEAMQTGTRRDEFVAEQVTPRYVSSQPVDFEQPSPNLPEVPPAYPAQQTEQDGVMPPTHDSEEVQPQQVHETLTLPKAANTISPRFPDLPLAQQHVRETYTSLPKSADVPTIRTSAGKGVTPHQQRTSLPHAPSQIVLRPTIKSSPLNIDDVSPDRWPSLPNEPAETPRDPAIERQRRERLKHEQEGRAWSE